MLSDNVISTRACRDCEFEFNCETTERKSMIFKYGPFWNLASSWHIDPQKSTFFHEPSFIRGKWWFLKYRDVFTEAVNFLWINFWNAEMRGKREKGSEFLKMWERNHFCIRAKTENLDFERLRGIFRFFQNFPEKSSPRYVDSRALFFSRGKIRFYMNFWNFRVP